MKHSVRILLLFIFASIFVISAIEKSSIRISELTEIDIEVEISEDSEGSNSEHQAFFISYFHNEFHLLLRRVTFLSRSTIASGRNRLVHSSLNLIYYPQGPPAFC